MDRQCQSVLILLMASICALLLGMHLEREYASAWATSPRLISLIAPRDDSVRQQNSTRDSGTAGGGLRQGGRAGNTSATNSTAAGGAEGSKQRSGRGSTQHATGLRSQHVVCNGFPLPKKWEWVRVYNPAGVFDPARGWVVLLRHEKEWASASPTLAILMGKNRNAPSVKFAAEHQFLLQMDNDTLGADFARKHYGKAWLKAEDLRPFLWKGGIYAAASVWGENVTNVWECILKVDLDQRLLSTEYCFDKMPIREYYTMEKNWALAVVDDSLIFLHQLAPCLVWLRFAPAAPKGLELYQTTCFSEEQHLAMRDFTGTAFTEKQHISGLLVNFPKSLISLDAERMGYIGSNTTQQREHFLMAHTRHKDGRFEHNVYSHWGFRINAKTLQLTHISRGPIVSSYMARRPHDFLTVMSYHFTRVDDADSLLVFYGRNDTKSCFDTLPAEQIEWYELEFGVENVDVSDPSKLHFQLT